MDSGLVSCAASGSQPLELAFIIVKLLKTSLPVINIYQRRPIVCRIDKDLNNSVLTSSAILTLYHAEQKSIVIRNLFLALPCVFLGISRWKNAFSFVVNCKRGTALLCMALEPVG